MTLSITLDWLAMTFKGVTREFLSFRDLYASAEPISDDAARNGYNSARRDKNGVVCMWHTDREEMGYHVIFAGSALRNIFRDGKVSQRDMVKAALNSGASITRLDVAKDAQDVPINLNAIWDCIQAKDYKAFTRTFSTIVNQDGARTIYIGSRTSERFARIYDKLAEQGLTQGHWYRYELETKGMVARALGSVLVDLDNWASAFDSMAQGMVNIPRSADFQRFFAPGTVLVGIPKMEKKTDREAWIQTQVIAAVAEHYQEYPESEAIKLLIDTLDFINRSRKAGES